MSKLFGFAGTDDFCPGGTIYPNPKDSSFLLPLGQYASAPVVREERFEQKNETSIEDLPDECLFEIFRRLPGNERSTCAGVSKRWLSLLSNICRDEICNKRTTEDDPEVEDGGFVSRRLEGKNATDNRLAAIAVGTASRGGLGKLSVHGSNPTRGVTDAGIKAIARGCPSLRVLSLWNLPFVGDEGLSEIGNHCYHLEKLDLSNCPAVTDKGLLAIASNCPNLTKINIEHCSNIGNEGLQALDRYCSKLKSISIKDCPSVGDQGIASLVSSASCVLTKINLQGLNITDVSLAVIGHYGMAVTELVFTSLANVTQRGFWVMGNGHGLQKLKSLTVASCPGATDTGLEAVANGCPNLRQFCLHRCTFLSDNGVVSFARAARSLESLQLHECHRISQIGFYGLLLSCGAKLKAFSLVNCFGIKDTNLGYEMPLTCQSLRTICIRNCPGFGDASLAILGKLCPQLQNVELSGLQGVTDAGLLPILEGNEAGLVKVDLSGCFNLSDKVVSSMTRLHGWTLEVLNLAGCRQITDASLASVADNCLLLSDLDISKCAVTDSGIHCLTQSASINLQILSLSGCSMISDKSVEALKKLGRTLTGLNLQRCNAISSSSIDVLIELLWRCDILS